MSEPNDEPQGGHPLGFLFGQDAREKVTLGVLTKEEIDMFGRLRGLSKEIRRLQAERETVHNAFWAGIELRLGVYGRGLSIDEKTTEILAPKEEEEG